MKTLIAIPIGDKPESCFFSSMLNLQVEGQVEFCVIEQTLVYNARNLAGQRAAEGGFDRILFFDADMNFKPDIMKRLSAHLDNGIEMITGVYPQRKPPIRPAIFKKIKYEPVEEQEGAVIPVAEFYTDYPKDSLFEIAGAGMGGCMMTVDLVKRVQERYGVPFSPMIGFGEDLSFCKRATDLGAHIWCDSSIKLEHCGKYLYSDKDYGVL